MAMVLPMVSMKRCLPVSGSLNVRGIALPTILIFLAVSTLMLLGTLQEALKTLRLTSLDLRMAQAERLMMSARDSMESYLRGEIATAEVIAPSGFRLSSESQERDCPHPDWHCQQITIVIAHQLNDVTRVWQGIWYETDDDDASDDYREAGWLP